MTRDRHGRFRLHLPRRERVLLRGLPGQLRELLDAGDPAIDRLFPPAHPDDARLEEDYRSMVGQGLREERRSALQVMEGTIDAEELDEDQVSSWLSALNDLRLVLGSRLEVTEEMYETGIPEDDPRHAPFALYVYLGWLEEHVVAALAEGIDPGEDDAQAGRG